MTTLHGSCTSPPGARPYCSLCPAAWVDSWGRVLRCEHGCHDETED